MSLFGSELSGTRRLTIAVVCQSTVVAPTGKTQCLLVGNNRCIIAYKEVFVNIIGLIWVYV